jgi:hypothetical protein
MPFNAEQTMLISEMILEDQVDGDTDWCRARLKHVIANTRDEHGMPELELVDREAIWAKLVSVFADTEQNQLYTLGFIGGAKQALGIEAEFAITV